MVVACKICGLKYADYIKSPVPCTCVFGHVYIRMSNAAQQGLRTDAEISRDSRASSAPQSEASSHYDA